MSLQPCASLPGSGGLLAMGAPSWQLRALRPTREIPETVVSLRDREPQQYMGYFYQ